MPEPHNLSGAQVSPIALIDGTAGARLPIKPAHGNPCNGCGLCCAMEPCGVAREFIPDHPEEGPCLALEWEAGPAIYDVDQTLATRGAVNSPQACQNP